MTTKEKIAVMQAYEKGKQIQYRGKHNTLVEDDWEDTCFTPDWNWAVFDYRIKPEEEKPVRMTNRQLAEYVKDNSKEYRESLKGNGIVRTNVDYPLEDENKECDECIKVRSNFGEWRDPTVDLLDKER